MQLGSGFRILSPGVSHPLSWTPSQRQHQMLLVSVIAVAMSITQRNKDNQGNFTVSPGTNKLRTISHKAMPELPEVETVRKVLEPQLRERRILNVSIRKPQVVAYPQESVFKSELEGVKIETLARRGKFLIARLESGKDLVIHLRMTGSLVVIPEND